MSKVISCHPSIPNLKTKQSKSKSIGTKEKRCWILDCFSWTNSAIFIKSGKEGKTAH